MELNYQVGLGLTRQPGNSNGRATLPVIWRNCMQIKGLMLSLMMFVCLQSLPSTTVPCSTIPARMVLLLPTADALIKRLQNRAGPYDEFLIKEVPWWYSYLYAMPMAGWTVLDSSEWTIEQTFNEVLSRIEP